LNSADRALAKLLVERSFIPGDFTLSSGRRSDYYFDCRVTTCFPDAMPLIGKAFVAELRRAGTAPRSVGGMTMGADPIANAIAYYSLGDGPSLGAFTVRKERKQHGTRRWIEGCAEAPVVVVDDVVTSGGSVLRSIERIQEEGLAIVHVVVLVDREEGGMEAIRAKLPGTPVSAIFTKTELEALRAQERGPARVDPERRRR
jgi:orotate phosphoribosyltransferase